MYIQLKFEFDPGQMTFDRVTPLNFFSAKRSKT